MDEQLTTFERRLRSGVSTYLVEARLELAPAVVVADVTRRGAAQPREWPSARVVVGLGIALIALALVATLYWLRDDQSVIPASSPTPSATPTNIALTPTVMTPSPSPTQPPSQSPTRPTPATSPSASQSPYGFDGRLPQPSALDDVSLFLVDGTHIELTNRRDFALDIRNAYFDALSSTRAVVRVAGDGGSTWLADWEQLTLTQVGERDQPLDTSPRGDEFVTRHDIDAASAELVRRGADGQATATVVVPADTIAVYLANGNLALSKADRLSIWPLGAADLLDTEWLVQGRPYAIGDDVVVTRSGLPILVDPLTGVVVQDMPTSLWPPELPSPNGMRAVTATYTSVVMSRLIVHDVLTGDVAAESIGFLDLSERGAAPLYWLGNELVVARVPMPTGTSLFATEPRVLVFSAASLATPGTPLQRLTAGYDQLTVRNGVLIAVGDGHVVVSDITVTP